MNYLIAKNDKQLGVCLKFLYSERESFKVDVFMNEKQKIEFHIVVETNETRFNELKAKYETLIK